MVQRLDARTNEAFHTPTPARTEATVLRCLCGRAPRLKQIRGSYLVECNCGRSAMSPTLTGCLTNWTKLQAQGALNQ